MAGVTILEVAAEAQVSKTTASDILRGAERSYSAATVGLVRETAARLGYQAHAAARLLRQGTSNIIGLAVGARQRPYINSLVVTAHDECLRRGFQPAIFEPQHLLPSHNFSPFPSPELLAGMLSIDLSVNHSMPDFYAAWNKRLPILALYPTEASNFDCVTTDWGRGIELAVAHLVELGHTCIAYAHDPSLSYAIDRVRAASWERCMDKYRLNAECQVTYKVPAPLATLGDQLINSPPQPISFFANQVLEALRRVKNVPTAILCTSDELAIALAGRLSELGWRLPHDLSLVGCYGIEFGDYVFPRLTSLGQPLELIGPAALDRLMARIANKADVIKTGAAPLEACHLLLEPQLIVRDSTAPPRAGQAPRLN